MKNNQSKSANSTLRLLSAMLVSEGDLTEQKRIRWDFSSFPVFYLTVLIELNLRIIYLIHTECFNCTRYLGIKSYILTQGLYLSNSAIFFFTPKDWTFSNKFLVIITIVMLTVSLTFNSVKQIFVELLLCAKLWKIISR